METQNKVLMLKTVDSEFKAYGGFTWPPSGEVVATDWNPEPVCGGGLHGFLWGKGDYGLASRAQDAIWIVFEASSESVVWVGADKVKVPSGNVIYAGNSAGAMAVLRAAKWGMDEMTATTGEYAHSSTTGKNSIAAGLGIRSKGKASLGGIIVLSWMDENTQIRIAVGYPGENDIKPDVYYCCDDSGNLVEAV